MRDWLWIAAGSYDGVLIPRDEGASLTPYLDHYQKLLSLDDWYCLIFQNPVELDPAMLGRVLPLKATGAGNLSSFDLSHQTRQKSDTNGLHIVHHGQHRRFDLATAKAVDPLEFWDFSRLDVTRSQPLATASGQIQPTVVQAPSQNAQIVEIANMKSSFDDVRAAIDRVPNTNWREKFHGIIRALLGVFSVIVVFLAIAFVLGVVAVVSDVGSIVKTIIPFVLAAFIFWLIWPKIQPRTIGREGVAQQAERANAASNFKGPGLFDRLKGWMLWNTSMGNRLRSKLERNMSEVSKMIERGEIDRALKRAMALGADQEGKKAKSSPMTSLPDPRATLDLDYSGVNAPAASILTEYGFEAMATQYRALAQKLSAVGDHRRAAFIYSELLKDVPSALVELETMKAYEDAAKLATARNRPGHVVARLWFLAGKKDIALAMAKRFDAMEFVANTAEKTDPEFSAFVRGHWIEALIAAGDLARAVKESAGRPQLRKLHVAVVKQAVLAGLLDETIVLVAATTSLAWRVEALDAEPIAYTEDVSGMLEARLHRIVNGADASEAEARRVLVAGLRDAKTSKEPIAETFWSGRAPMLADVLIRSILAHDASYASVPQLKELKRFAKNMGLYVMAEDLRHIMRNKPERPQQRRNFPLPAAKPSASYWTMVACTANGCTLIGAHSGELALVDKVGARLWTDHVTDLVGIIPIGPGRLVLLVQGNSTDRKLTVVDTVLHSYRVLGRIALTTWHTYASASSWLVQSPSTIGALNVTALLDTSPVFELLWSINQTVPIRVLAFQNGPDWVHWVSQRMDQGSPGILEIWRLTPRDHDLKVKIVDPRNDATKYLYKAPHLLLPFWQFAALEQVIGDNRSLFKSAVVTEIYSYEGEKRVLQENAEFWKALKNPASITSVEENLACATYKSSSDRPHVELLRKDNSGIAVLKGATIVTQFTSENGERLVVIDDCGRVILCDLKQQTVKLANL